jgi:hypothetical protein
MKVSVTTLGCKVNQVETQEMERILLARGHTLVPPDGAAEVYIVNSCTVTAVSDHKSRQAVRRAQKRGQAQAAPGTPPLSWRSAAATPKFPPAKPPPWARMSSPEPATTGNF